jgi:hypothetical protein
MALNVLSLVRSIYLSILSRCRQNHDPSSNVKSWLNIPNTSSPIHPSCGCTFIIYSLQRLQVLWYNRKASRLNLNFDSGHGSLVSVLFSTASLHYVNFFTYTLSIIGVSSGIRSNAPFQTLKRQQASQILNATTRNIMGRQTVRSFSSEIATAMVQVSQNLGMGSAAIGK